MGKKRAQSPLRPAAAEGDGASTSQTQPPVEPPKEPRPPQKVFYCEGKPFDGAD